MIKITKFGGSSVADAEQFKKVKAIIEADPSRRFVVSSASGKRFKGDNKITDLLYLCQAHVTYHVDYLPLFNMIADRFRSIRDELGLKVDIETDLAKMRDSLPEMSVDEIVSRGEYFTSRLMADYLGFPFVDATDVVCINFDGTFNFNETTERLKEILKKHDRFVMPGFYGRLPDGHVRVMSRGGSDISGSILARCIQADLYENWTDVSGFLMADPRIVENPRNIEQITFSSRGVSVASTDMSCSFKSEKLAASLGSEASSSGIKSPRWESSSSPIGVSRLTGSCAILRMSRTFSTGMFISAAISSALGSWPSSCSSWRETRMTLLIVSTICTGMRIVRAWSAMARVMA